MIDGFRYGSSEGGRAICECRDRPTRAGFEHPDRGQVVIADHTIVPVDQPEEAGMAWTQVTAYYVFWDVDGHNGNIQLNLADNTGWAIGGQTPEEMHMLVDLLRNESPIYFEDTSRLLIVGSEPVGEGE
jgi:hypothetical protein